MMTIEAINERFRHLPEYIIELGVLELKSKRKQTVQISVTNAQLMFIHENGSPLRNIPARPVLQMTIDWANTNIVHKTLDKCIDIFLTEENYATALTNVEHELNRMCMRIQSYARQIIYKNDGRLAPNSPRVAAKKKGNHPLFDTGQLARSITCTLIKG